MANLGLDESLAAAGIEIVKTQVGDRYVHEEMQRRGANLGGEQSGHIIDRNFVPSGDGIASALLTLEALNGADLANRHAMEKLPQTLVNVKVRDRGALEHAADVHAAVARESANLEGRGRVLLRPSGTEPLVRVMVEAPTADEAEAVTSRLVELVRSRLT
jgi:phosphoglucosamine mutase